MFDPLVGVEVLVGPGPSLLFVGGLRVVVGSEEGGGLDIEGDGPELVGP